MWKRLSRLQIAFLVVIVYAIVIGIWAVRPLSESLDVGTDWTPTLLDPPQGSRDVRQEVSCNSLLSGSPRSDEPLPELTAQPAGKAPLAFARVPCQFVQSDARRAFVIDIIAIGAVVGLLVWLSRRRREPVAVV